ncbi:UPF0687 protein C20orf27 like [Dissostichus eleginoides]|uniref:UPF0687 protein C20orf27 like n=1 Tax=Dissostichus eleginoides TaxID=100907 RepID=A0AAD9EYG9_DISEL|nr:UPF0687 protein C20orf27 like [Dissostichus eleginoides]
MASGRKGSTSKAGGVRFPDDDDEPPGSPSRRDDELNLSTLIAVLEKDGGYLAGFLKSHHLYEIVFTVPDVPTLAGSSPASGVQRIASTLEGGLKVTCEYRTHQEGMLQEELTLATRGRKGSQLKVTFQAKVIDQQHGTPMLMEGVRCIGARKDSNSRRSSDHEKK